MKTFFLLRPIHHFCLVLLLVFGWPSSLLGQVVISEFMADNRDTLKDGDGNYSDWIELFNTGNATVSLQGWSLTDDPALPQKWIFPAVSLPPGKFLLVFASGQGGRDGAGHLHCNFSLRAEGEYLGLCKPDKSVADSFAPTFPAQRPDVSYGKSLNLTFTRLSGSGDRARFLVPTAADHASIGKTWRGADPFVDATWTSVTLPIGFDGPAVNPPGAVKVNLRNASTTFAQANYGIEEAVDGITAGTDNGWGVFGGHNADQFSVFQTAVPQNAEELEVRLVHNSTFAKHAIKEFRISVTTQADATVTSSTEWIPLHPSHLESSAGSSFTPTGDGRFKASGVVTADTYKLLFKNVPTGIQGFRLEVFASDSNADGTPTLGRDTASGENGNFVLSEFEVEIPPRGPEIFNLTRRQTVEASGPTYGGYPASNLTDDSVGTFSHNATQNKNFAYWMKVAENLPLDVIEVINRADCCPERLSNYRVRLYQNNQGERGVLQWSGDVRTDQSNSGNGGIDRIYGGLDPVGSFQGGWLEVQNIDNNTDRYLQIAEVRAIATNWARYSKVLSAQAPAAGMDWSSLVDGDLLTFAHDGDASGPVSKNSRIELDLRHTVALSAIQVFGSRTGDIKTRLRNYRLSVHDDAAGKPGTLVWQTVVREGGAPLKDGQSDLLRADQGEGVFQGQWIVIQNQDEGQARYLEVAEVRAFGAAGNSGYDSTLRTDVETLMKGKNASGYLRIPFVVSPTSSFDGLKFRMRADDGFVAYLNGTELSRSGVATADPAFDAAAQRSLFANRVEESGSGASLIKTGLNILAIHGLNASAADADYLIAPELFGRNLSLGGEGFFTNPSPHSVNGSNVVSFLQSPRVSQARGFFESAFTVTLTSTSPGAALVFTLNGSAPTEQNGTRVEPRSGNDLVSTNLTVTKTTILRVASTKPTFAPSPIQTHSYFFLADVIRQPILPPGFPPLWGSAVGDYEMDPAIVDHADYRDEIIQDLRAIPTLSIVMDPEDFLGSQRGIYTFPENRGPEWERPASFEYIRSDGKEGFAESGGVEIWGFGWRPHISSLKHSLKMSFKDRYGAKKLKYPLFSDSPVTRFDEVVLRAQGSRSYNDTRMPDRDQTQYTHDSWARDTARDMGKLDGHSTYVHLYINGLYWGLYNPVERPAEGYAVEYFGGDKEDFDIINRRDTTEALAGDLDAWNQMQTLADAGLENPARYALMENYVDIDNLIDYVLLNQFASNHDGPDSNSNNMRAIRPRQGDGRFRFFVWDMEYTLWYARENRNIHMDVPNTASHIYARLRANPDFRLRFADRVQKHLFHGGALTKEAALARYHARANEVFGPVVGETARWGDVRREPPYMRQVEWVEERRRLTEEFFPERGAVLLQQLREAGLFPLLDAPSLIAQEGSLTVEHPSAEIYFTLDGSDPRMIGGEIHPSTMVHQSHHPLILSNAPARLLAQGSGLDPQWYYPNFNDSSWPLGKASLSYDSRPVQALQPVPLQNATADFSQANNPVTAAIDGDANLGGWGLYHNIYQSLSRSAAAVFETISDISHPAGAELRFTIAHTSTLKSSLGRFRISCTGDPRSEFADGKINAGDVVANWVVLRPVSVFSQNGSTMTIKDDGSILVSGTHPDFETYTIVARSGLGNITGFKLETFEDPTLPGRGPGRNSDANAVITEFSVAAAPLPKTVSFPASSELASMKGVSSSAFVRIPFEVSTPEIFDRLQLALQYDDGFVAFLNGEKIASAQAPETLSPTAKATAARADHACFEPQVFSVPGRYLQPGKNVLAIQLLNADVHAADAVLSVRLTGLDDLKIFTHRNQTIKARARKADTWSALLVSNIVVSSPLQSLRVSEVMYHPSLPNNPGDYDEADFEFVELKNIGATVLNLANVRLNGGVDFAFGPTSQLLNPGDYVVLVENKAAFLSRYGSGVRVAGQFRGNLDNGSDTVELLVGETMIQQFTYSDEWVPETDGSGYSLTFKNPASPLDHWRHALYWKKSSVIHGTPGKGDDGSVSLFDSDQDGLSDGWEQKYFGGLSRSAAEDSDGDGATNQSEYVAGTDPQNAGDKLALRVARDPLSVSYPTTRAEANLYAGQVRVYTLEQKLLGEEGPWQPVAGWQKREATGLEHEYVIPENQPATMYRLIVTLESP